MLGWLKKRPERRSGYSDLILGALESAAATRAANVGASAAVEAVAGLLARTLSNAQVDSPDWLEIAPGWLSTVARQLVRDGDHLSAMRMDTMTGKVSLIPAGHWHWHGGGAMESGWTASVTLYGPAGSEHRTMSRDEVVFIQWARFPVEPHRGRSPGGMASLAARAAAEVERSLGDEASGPLAQLLTVPESQDPDSDEYAGIRSGLNSARGKAVLLESNAGGAGNRADAPQRDWLATRLGPSPTEPMVRLAQGTFSRMVAAAGASESLFVDADGTAQREAWRRWHLSTVLPVARLIEYELTQRTGYPVRLKLDQYAADLQGRATAFQKLVAGGMDLEQAARLSGVLMSE